MDSNGTMSRETFFMIARIDMLIYMTTTFVSWFGNGILVGVTIYSKKLRGSCNLLIGVQAFSDILMQMAHPYTTYTAFTETFTTFRKCYYATFFFFVAIDFSTLLMFFIALDRFIAAMKPFVYSRIAGCRYYVLAVISICLLYSLSFKAIIYTGLTDQTAFCLLTETMSGILMNVWFGACTVINLGVIGVYFALTKFVKVSVTEYKKINRSLSTMIALYICGWLATMVGCSTALLVSPDRRVYTAAELTIGIFCNVNIATPFFVYYTQSTLYRREIRKMFGRNQVADVNVVGSTASKYLKAAPATGSLQC